MRRFEISATPTSLWEVENRLTPLLTWHAPQRYACACRAHMSVIDVAPKTEYGLRRGAEEFPLMVVISVIYPCNMGCPFCPYTDGNSELRKFYHEHGGDLLPVGLWNKMADECGPYGAWMRCTGGGEPMLHKNMVDMIEYAKARG